MPKIPNNYETEKHNHRGLGSANDARKKFRQDMIKTNDDFKAELQQEKRESNLVVIPDRFFERRCHVCSHPFRDWVEMMLIKGMPYKTLSDRVTPPLHRHSIANHYKNHMDLQDTAIRAILEQEAKLQGINSEEGSQDIITKRGVLEVALRKGYQDVLDGVTTVEPRDLIQMIKVLADMDSNQQSLGLDEARAQVEIFIQAIKAVCSVDMQNEIADKVRELRKRERIDSKFESIIKDPPLAIPEASVVEVV